MEDIRKSFLQVNIHLNANWEESDRNWIGLDLWELGVEQPHALKSGKIYCVHLSMEKELWKLHCGAMPMLVDPFIEVHHL